MELEKEMGKKKKKRMKICWYQLLPFSSGGASTQEKIFLKSQQRRSLATDLQPVSNDCSLENRIYVN